MFIDKKRKKVLALRKNHQHTLAPKQVENLEKKIGAAFPNDYRKFIVEYGGWWIDAEFDIDPHCPSGSVQLIEKFYGIENNDSSSNDIWNNYQIYSDRLSPKLLPIGHDAMGNEIVLSLRKNDYGTVSFLDRSQEGTPGANVFKNKGLYKCADTFTKFFESLRPVTHIEEENEKEIRENEDPEAAQIRNRLLSGKLSFEEQKQFLARLNQIVKRRKRR